MIEPNLDSDSFWEKSRLQVNLTPGIVATLTCSLLLQVITDLFALLTICCRRCVCCSVFTVCGSVQSFAGMLFVIGLVAYPAGWGHEYIKTVRTDYATIVPTNTVIIGYKGTFCHRGKLLSAHIYCTEFLS